MNNLKALSSEKKGTWFAIVSGLLYGLLGYFGVSLLNTGFSVFNVAFLRFAMSSLFLLVFFIAKSATNAGSWRQCILTMLNGGIFYGAPGCLFFFASNYIGTGQAMVIFFVFPVFVMLLNWLFLKQPLTPQYFISFIVILMGLIMLVDIGEVSFDLLGIVLSLCSALSYAIYIFFSKKMVALPPLNSSLMVSVGCTLVCGALAFFDRSIVLPHEPAQWFHILGIGIVCSALPILFMFEALKHISSNKASLLSVLEPVFVVIFGVLLLGEVLKINTVVGIVLTLLGAMSVMVKWKIPVFFRFKRT